MSAEMERFIMADSHRFVNIQDIIEDIRYVPVVECVAELQGAMIINKDVEEFLFNMYMNIIAADALAVM